ncbi:flagellar basal body protein [Fluviibacterium sp. DFM31]|uniref:Flagellar basal body protein n=1 Tax=Meridianimarinicoccus marinus TaxID=3231483 RepID=A0ABV3L342_9RHOB
MKLIEEEVPMFNGLDLFNLASNKASHAGMQQAMIARNVANADTPGYKAAALEPFSIQGRSTPARLAMAQSRPGHQAAPADFNRTAFRTEARDGDAAPNGNTVSLETEMLEAARVKQDHDLALAAYRGGMTLLRTVLGRAG